MRNIVLCMLLLFSCFAAQGQAYRYMQIKEKTDSLLSSTIGRDLFQYCNINDAGSYYSYHKKTKELFKRLNRRHTYQHLVSAVVSYHFAMPYPKCTCMDTITCDIIVALDTALALTHDIDVSSIPDFVTQHDSCHFITKKKAIEIALRQHLHTSVATPYAYLTRQVRTSNILAEVILKGKDVSYTWIVLRTIWNEKSTSGYNYTTDDMVVIDAGTGEVKENKVIPYALHVY